MRYQPETSLIFAVLWGCALANLAWAQTVSSVPAPVPTAQLIALPASAKYPERTIGQWLTRMHEAARLHSYAGTFVVSFNNGALSSAHVWHACEGEKQIERVESLTGAPRSTFRRNEEVVTFLPESQVVRVEKRESLGLFPNSDLLKTGSIPEFYEAHHVGVDRVAGFDTDVVQLEARDNLRFGYRIWSERKTGLVVKLQILDNEGQVLEQTAFSELQFNLPLSVEKLNRLMAVPAGWHIQKIESTKTNAAEQGWQLKSVVAGFKPVSCYKRPVAGGTQPDGVMQWIFSDGLAAVSLFLEAYDSQRHVQEGLFSNGATQTLTRRMQDWWLTVVGEVPPQTLKAFAQSLERRN